ncbi:hypothetical protein BDZ94DRAFT_1248865 [Collybia nuda]|uniref:F-box domain-containing protein n=1 Tax=Collybia nuda TaxID=64659 RepID=A0A9P5YHI3_9AGAR|nr:hypothetical protein BDZ94DRAFT_1248865 [Collybia nuda]
MGLQDVRVSSLFKIPRQFTQKDRKRKTEPSNIILPTELWLEILDYISLENIEALSLTCHALRLVAQPFLFRTVVMHPFLDTIAYRRLNLEAYVVRSFERLKFLASPRIAHHVREFSLVPYPTGHSLSRRGPPQVPENTIVNQVFDILPLLPNLRTLMVHCIKSTPRRMEVLRGLHLDVLALETRGDDITWHSSDDDNHRVLTPIPSSRYFSFNCNAGPHQMPLFSVIPLDFLHRDSIVNISSGPNGTESVLEAITLSPSLFLALTNLDLSVRFVSTPTFVMALQQCPNLRSIRLRAASTDSPAHARPMMKPLPSDAIPLLSHYHGPPSLAPIFALNRTLSSVKLWSSRSIASVTKPTVLTSVLPQLGSHVQSLEIGVTTVPIILMEILQQSFPDLKSLSVNAHLAGYNPGTVYTRTVHTHLTPELNPSVIRSGKWDLDILSIGTQLPDTTTTDSPEQEVVAMEALTRFPLDYDPTSWGQWAIESPWSKIVWQRLHGEALGGKTRGRLSIEYVEYIKPTFQTTNC